MDLISTFQDLVAQVPALLQPAIIALAGAVPFIEGEGAAAIGIIGGIHPAVAAIAGAVGNFVCVALLVLVSAGARGAVVSQRRARAAARLGDGSVSDDLRAPASASTAAGPGVTSARAAKFQRAFERYGLPGVSLLGPLLLPTHFTATLLAASGVAKGRILIWQAVAIVVWTAAITLLFTGVVNVIG